MEASEFCNLLYQLAARQPGRNVELELNGVPVLIVQDIDAANRVLRGNAANYRKNLDWFRQALGASRLTEDGEAWRVRRDASQEFLTRFDRGKAFALACRHAEAGAAAMLGRSGAEANRLDDGIFHEIAAGVMLELFFDRDLETAGVNVADISSMIAFGSEFSVVPPGQDLAPSPEGLRTFLSTRNRVLRSLQSFRGDPVPGGTLLGALLELDAEGREGFVLEHELTLFFAAGAETTSASMGWACYLLAKYPLVQDALRSAVREFWQGPECGWDALMRVEMLHRFIDEVLRVFPPTPLLGRLAVEADVLGGLVVRPGDNVMVSLMGLHHDPVDEDPFAIDVPLVLTGEGRRRRSMPFSSGARSCPGGRFALVNLASILSVFLPDARFERTSTGDPEFHWNTQLVHRGGQPVRMTRI
jgi:cytochrome P450